jgi:hypothetical protein
MMWLAAGLAFAAAFCYLMIPPGFLEVGDLSPREQPLAIVLVAAGGYMLGGLLILLRWRWLWVVGAMINGLVILIFLLAYFSRPLVLISPGGLFTKLAEILLEVSLLYLIFTTSGHRSSRQHEPIEGRSRRDALPAGR